MKPESPVEPVCLSIAQAARLLGICPRSVQRMVKRGQLRAVRAGRRILIPKTELQRWIDSQLQQQAVAVGLPAIDADRDE